MKGVYVLIILIRKNVTVNVGALGGLFFKKGLYAYVGSGQNGVEKRIERHLRKVKRKFWHIDYLLANDAARVVKVFSKEAGKPEECRIARIIGEKAWPIGNFGCSDCGCVSHLFMLSDSDCLESSMALLPRDFICMVQA